MSTNNFASDGFDLDAIAGNDDDVGDVVYELGGGATAEKPPAPEPAESSPQDVLSKAEEWKQQGNDQFKAGNYLEASDLYTEAIEVCPGELKGEDILKKRDEYNEQERAKAISRQRLGDEDRRKKSNDNNKDSKNDDPSKSEPPAQFKLPPQDHGEKLAIYYCNRAAALLHMERYDDAITDCAVSLLLNVKYTKAYVRRSAAYEKLERTEEALRDAKKALELEPANAAVRKSVARLQKIEDARLEKLKDETLGKLKDLGNSLLGNFGLSLDNFAAVQDPSSGSYNISFNQDKK